MQKRDAENVDLTEQSLISNVEDSEKAELQKLVLRLESEIASLKRVLPKMKDVDGSDSTDKIKQMCDNWAIAEQNAEKWENKYAETEQSFTKFKRKTNDELDSRDNQITQMKIRAKQLEDENERLKEQAKNDQSRIFHLQSDADISERQNLSMGEFERTMESDEVPRIKQELAEKADENIKLTEQLEEARQIIVDLREFQEQQKFVKQIAGRDVEEDSIFALPKAMTTNTSYTDADYIFGQLLALLPHTDDKPKDLKAFSEEVLKLARAYGYNTEQKNVAEISKEMEISFRSKFNERRSQIKRTNQELANELRLDNTELGRHLHQLSDDSSFARSFQPVGDSRAASFIMDLGSSTAGVDILNKTVLVAQDLGAVVSRMNGLRIVCNQLFDKLRGTAEFLQSLLDALEDSEEGRELLRKINELKLDLDKSMGEARILVKEVEKAEKNVSELREILEQTLDQSTMGQSQLQTELPSQSGIASDELKLEIDRLKGIEGQYEALKLSLNNELNLKETLNKNLTEVQKQMAEKELQFGEKIRLLESDLDTKTRSASHLQEKYEEQSRALVDLESKSKEKDSVISEKEQERQRLEQLLKDSKVVIKETGNQLSELLTSSQSLHQATLDYQSTISDKENIIAEMEEKLRSGRNEDNSQKCASLMEELSRTKASLEKEIASLHQEKSEIVNKNDALEKQMRDLETRIHSDHVPASTTNALILDVTQTEKGMEEISLECSFVEDPNDENLCGFDAFTDFLSECGKRSNAVVQYLKKAEEESIANGFQIRGIQLLLDEARSVRWILHKLTCFFMAEKPNLKKSNKELGKLILSEIKSICNTLESASQSLHSDAPKKSSGGHRR